MAQQVSRLGTGRTITGKHTALLCGSILFIFLCSCSGNLDHKQPEQGIPYDEMVSQTGLELFVPERAEKISYHVTENEAGEDMAQVNCEIDGDVVRIIAVKSKDADGTFTNLYGINTWWMTEQTCTIRQYDAFLQVNDNGVGYIAWRDAKDILYNVCILKNTSHQAHDNLAICLAGVDKLKGLAEEVAR